MARRKTTVYIDEALLREAKISAARSGRREYEVFEDALREHLALGPTVKRIWAGIDMDSALSEIEAERIAQAELAAVREQHARELPAG